MFLDGILDFVHFRLGLCRVIRSSDGSKNGLINFALSDLPHSHFDSLKDFTTLS